MGTRVFGALVQILPLLLNQLMLDWNLPSTYVAFCSTLLVSWVSSSLANWSDSALIALLVVVLGVTWTRTKWLASLSSMHLPTWLMVVSHECSQSLMSSDALAVSMWLHVVHGVPVHLTDDGWSHVGEKTIERVTFVTKPAAMRGKTVQCLTNLRLRWAADIVWDECIVSVSDHGYVRTTAAGYAWFARIRRHPEGPMALGRIYPIDVTEGGYAYLDMASIAASVGYLRMSFSGEKCVSLLYQHFDDWAETVHALPLGRHCIGNWLWVHVTDETPAPTVSPPDRNGTTTTVQPPPFKKWRCRFYENQLVQGPILPTGPRIEHSRVAIVTNGRYIGYDVARLHVFGNYDGRMRWLGAQIASADTPVCGRYVISADVIVHWLGDTPHQYAAIFEFTTEEQLSVWLSVLEAACPLIPAAEKRPYGAPVIPVIRCYELTHITRDARSVDMLKMIQRHRADEMDDPAFRDALLAYQSDEYKPRKYLFYDKTLQTARIEMHLPAEDLICAHAAYFRRFVAMMHDTSLRRKHFFGFLFYGAPGCGKTTLMMWIIKHLAWPIMQISCKLIHDDRDLVELLKRKSFTVINAGGSGATMQLDESRIPIIVLDEIDLLGVPLMEAMQTICDSTNGVDDLVILATTNNFPNVPEALRRPERLTPMGFTHITPEQAMEHWRADFPDDANPPSRDDFVRWIHTERRAPSAAMYANWRTLGDAQPAAVRALWESMTPLNERAYEYAFHPEVGQLGKC